MNGFHEMLVFYHESPSVFHEEILENKEVKFLIRKEQYRTVSLLICVKIFKNAPPPFHSLCHSFCHRALCLSSIKNTNKTRMDFSLLQTT